MTEPTELITLLSFIKSQVPGWLMGVINLAAIVLYAIKAKWIPLSFTWGTKKIIAPEERHYVTKEHLMKNCDDRQSKLDKKLDEQFKEVFTLLRDIKDQMETAIKDMTKQIAEHDGSIRVLQDRTSHHRKDDAV